MTPPRRRFPAVSHSRFAAALFYCPRSRTEVIGTTAVRGCFLYRRFPPSFIVRVRGRRSSEQPLYAVVFCIGAFRPLLLSAFADGGHRNNRCTRLFFVSALSRGADTKKSPIVRSRERWGQNAISRPLKRRRAKRQNGGAACYWQEPRRRGKQPAGSRLVMVSIR